MGSEARARVGLGGLLLITLFSFAQVFAQGDYPGPALLGMMIAIGTTMLARRLGARAATSFLASGSVLIFYLTLIFAPGRSFYGLPTLGSLEQVRVAIARAIDASRIDYAPVPVRPGYVILVVIGMWAMATIGEIATFRWRRPLMASLGPIAMFSLIAIVGTRTGIGWLVAAFLTALFVYWGLESSHRLRMWGRWMPAWADHPEEAPASVTGSLARRMGASCVAAAVVAPLFLPGLSDALVPWRSGIGGGGFGVGSGEVNPLVQLQPQLINQSTEELFRVKADSPSYWKLISLVNFDGNEWTPQGRPSYALANQQVTTNFPTSLSQRSLGQTYTITGLGGDFLPAAVQPDTLTFLTQVDDSLVLINPATSDIQLTGGLTDGLEYTVNSSQPAVSFNDLQAAAPGDPGPEYVSLPNISEEVKQLARDLTAGAETRFEELLLIQDHLRGFRHDLTVEPAATADYLAEFLLDTRAGYCQQFATAFAVLARFLGFPTRVSVGFLPGATDISSPDLYFVRGTDAHAWPEVYFEGYGWIRFEPTPRSSVDQPRYTIDSLAQLPIGSRLDPSERQPLRGNLRDTLGGVRNACGNLGPGCDLGGRGRDPFANPGLGLGSRGTPAWVTAFTRLALVLGAALALFLVSVPSLKRRRVRRRYRKARTSDELAAAAFAEFEDEAAELARPRFVSESASEYARAVAAQKKVPRRPAVRLAAIYEAAEYAPRAIPSGQAGEAKRLARELRARLWQSSSWWRRTSRLFSPRGLGLTGLFR